MSSAGVVVAANPSGGAESCHGSGPSAAAVPEAAAFGRVRRREWQAYLLIAGAAILLSAAGAAIKGIPVPIIHDEHSHLFAGETFARLRLSSPSPPIPGAFFSPHILVEPSFASKYPPAQGLFLALGILLGLPIAGVWISGALAAGALLWCARGRMPLRLALIPTTLFMGTVLFADRWVLSYWGGLVTFAGGALVAGFFVRLGERMPRPHCFALGGAGAALLSLSRPFEGAVLCLLLVATHADRMTALLILRPIRRVVFCVAAAALPLLAALGFQVALNSAVTGHALRMPHSEFHQQYMKIPVFRWQQTVAPIHADLRLQAVEEGFGVRPQWRDQIAFSFRSAAAALKELGGRYYPALFLSAVAFALLAERRLLAVVVLMPLILALSNYVHFSHYFAPIVPLWFLLPGLAIASLSQRVGFGRGLRLTAVCTLVIAVTLPKMVSASPAVTSSVREQIVAALEESGPWLVFVYYGPGVSPHLNIVYNDPDLRNPVLFANYLDNDTSCALVRHFPERQATIVSLTRTAPGDGDGIALHCAVETAAAGRID